MANLKLVRSGSICQGSRVQLQSNQKWLLQNQANPDVHRDSINTVDVPISPREGERGGGDNQIPNL